MLNSIMSECPACAETCVVTDSNTGEILCGKCGLVVTDNIADTGAEWRSFGNDFVKARTGARSSLIMHDMGLSTVIGATNKDSTGKPLSANVKTTIQRLRTWDSRTQARTSAERNLRQALSEMYKMKDKIALTDAVVEKAAHIYRKAMEKKLVKGRSIQGVVAACIFASCRNAETPRTLDDVADGLNIRRKDVARCYRLIFRELNMKMPVVDPVKAIPRIASAARLSEKIKRRAATILNSAKDAGIVAGKDPMGIAAAALYLACRDTDEAKSQKDISKASGVTEVTIRNRCAGLKRMLD